MFGQFPSQVSKKYPLTSVIIFSLCIDQWMRRVLYRLPKLIEHLSALIPDLQFRFRSAHSSPVRLHRVIDKILATDENKKVCLGVFLDSEKCFYNVLHEGIPYKIKPHLPDTYSRLIQWSDGWHIDHRPISKSTNVRYLGDHLDSTPTWEFHIKYLLVHKNKAKDPPTKSTVGWSIPSKYTYLRNCSFTSPSLDLSGCVLSSALGFCSC